MAFPHPVSLSSSPAAAPINLRLQPLPSIALLHPTALLPFRCSLPLNLPALRLNRPRLPSLSLAASSDIQSGGFTGIGGDDDLPPSGEGSEGGGDEGHGGGGDEGHGRGGDEGHGEHEGGGDGDASINRTDALFVLSQLGRKLESLPADLAAAVEDGRIPGEIVRRYVDLEAKPFFGWLLHFRGLKERLLSDELWLTKVGIECGIGLFTKTAAEYQKRGEHFMEELDLVISDVVMALVADFMLVWIPSPTVSLQPPVLVTNSGAIAKFFSNCPDNGFQVALAGTSYSLLQRVGAIVRNGAKLFAVGTSASLIGIGGITALKKARKAVSKDSAVEVEHNILNYSMAYGVYMAVSSNLRYQIVAGVLEQRILQPLLHNHKVILSAACFAVRTGNTFFGSLLWIDFARFIGLH